MSSSPTSSHAAGTPPSADEILDSLSDGVIVLDAAWRLTYLNAAGARMLGLARADLAGRVLWEQLPELDGAPFGGAFRRAMADRIEVALEGQYPPCAVWLEARAIPRRDGGLLLLFRDIGRLVEERQAREALARDVRAERETLLARERSAHLEAEQQKNLLDLVVQQIGDGIVVSDERSVLRVFNPAAERMHGATKQEVEGPAWARTYGLFTLDGRPLPLDETPLYRAVQGERVENASWIVKRPDGALRTLRGTATPLTRPDGSRAGGVLVTRDETERLAAEQARLESERALRTLMGNMPGMAFRCRPSAPWEFEYASPGVVELTGYQPEDFYAGGSTTWFALMHPEDVERVERAAEEAFTGRRQLTVTYRIRTRAGEEKWVWDRSVGIYAEDGELQAIEGFVSDVTERTRAEQEREKLARLVENSPDFIGYAGLDGSPVYINRAGLQMVGLESLEAARARHILEYFPPEERAIMEDTVIPAVLRDGHWESDFRWRRFDTGAPIPVSFRMFTVPDPRTGQPLALATVMRDITEKKRHEQDERKRAEFEQQLIGIVSHDLRNPLNIISMGAQVLLRDEGLSERNTKMVCRIVSAADRATRMIRDLLDFTRARLGGGIPVSPAPLELHAHVAGVLEELRYTHPERDLRLEHDGDTRGAWDPDRIAQLVTNLVGNALKYSPPGSTVTVRTRGEPDAVVLEVHNVGPPIAPDLLPYVFEPLSRGASNVDVQTRSIGLGLYIVDNIARAHRGRVEARSTAEDGTTFVVRLPRA